jgi:predicted anti-sigma-YlaC factor YlaD
MNCKKIRELLLTDYLDKNPDENTMAGVRAHLEKCPECRLFESEIRESSVAPFKNLPRHTCPESVWLNIKEKIAERQGQQVSLLELIREKLKALSQPRPVLVFSSTMIILFIMLGVITKYSMGKNQVREYFAQQADFYSVLNQGVENDNNGGRLDNPMEEYIF